MPKLQQRTEKGKTVRKAFPIVASSDSTFHTIDGPQHVHGTAFSYAHANYLCGGDEPQEYDGDTANPF